MFTDDEAAARYDGITWVAGTAAQADWDGEVLRVDRMKLRFLDEAILAAAAGFDIEARYGRGDAPVGPGTRELLTIARRA